MSKHMNRGVTVTDWLKKPSTVLWIVVLLHLLVGVFYQVVVGLDIRANPGLRPWDWWWQNIPQDLLVTDLWRSVWYQHSQPPLFSLYAAVFFNLFPGQPMAAMQFSNILFGSVLAGLLYLILLMLSGRALLALAVGLILALDPGLFLFEAYILYDLVTTFFVVATVCTLAAYVRTQQVWFGVLFLAALSVLILVRSMYHLLLLPIGIVLIATAVPRHAKLLLAAAVIISLAPVGWYAKNYALYGFFGSSSWQGFSMWKVVSQSYTPEELATLRDQGVIEPVAAEIEPLRTASVYTTYGYTATSVIPVLSRDDRHNVNMIEAARAYQRSAMALLAQEPELYLRSAFNSYLIYNIPAAQFKHHVRNIEKIAGHAWIWSKLVQGNILERLLRFPIGSIFFFLVPASVLAYATRAGHEMLWRRRSLWAFLRENAVETWIVLLIAYTTLIGIFLEVGENNREKFYIEHLVVVYLVTLVARQFPSRLQRVRLFGPRRTTVTAGELLPWNQ